MGSVQKVVKCPKCGDIAFDCSIYSSGEEYCFCFNCGYHYNKEFKKNEKGDVVGKAIKRYDLAKEPVLYAAVEREKNEIKSIVKSMLIKPTDTMEDLDDFTGLFMELPFGGYDCRVPEKFADFEGTKEYQHIILDGKTNELLGGRTSWVVIADGILEVQEAEWGITEGGGYGTVMEWTEFGSCSRALSEGEIPEITEDTIFASAIINGKLTVMKSDRKSVV